MPNERTEFDENSGVELPDPAIPPLSVYGPIGSDTEVEVSNEAVVEDDDLPEELRGKSKQEIAAILKEERSRADVLRTQADSVAGMQAAVTALGERMSRSAGPSPVPLPQQPAESDEEFRKRIDDGVYDRGVFATTTEIQNRTMGPVVERMVANTEYFARRDLERDPSRAETYRRYQAEIDAEVAKMSRIERFNNPQAHIQAHDRVLLSHKDEVIELEVAARVAAKLKEAGIDPEAPVSSRTRPIAAFSESAINRPASSAGGTKGTRPMRLTTTEERHAASKGMSLPAYGGWKKRNPDVQAAHLANFVRIGR